MPATVPPPMATAIRGGQLRDNADIGRVELLALSDLARAGEEGLVDRRFRFGVTLELSELGLRLPVDEDRGLHAVGLALQRCERRARFVELCLGPLHHAGSLVGDLIFDRLQLGF